MCEFCTLENVTNFHYGTSQTPFVIVDNTGYTNVIGILRGGTQEANGHGDWGMDTDMYVELMRETAIEFAEDWYGENNYNIILHWMYEGFPHMYIEIEEI